MFYFFVRYSEAKEYTYIVGGGNRFFVFFLQVISMKLRTRKILFMIAALLSGLSTLMPFLIVHHEGITQRGFPVEI